MAIRKSDIGVNLNVDVSENISDATLMELTIRSQKNGVKRTFVGTLIGTQVVRYTMALPTDAASDATWDIQARVVQPGLDRSSTIGTFTIQEKL